MKLDVPFLTLLKIALFVLLCVIVVKVWAIVVMIIVGIMALVAAPSYSRAQQRATERTISDNLDVIWQAVLAYRNRQSPAAFPLPANMNNVANINNWEFIFYAWGVKCTPS